MHHQNNKNNMKKPALLSLQKIVLASTNPGKLEELAYFFAQTNILLEPQNNFTENHVEETGLSFIENALIKARFAAKHSGLPALADDSGLCVDVLDGAPGIYSARYATSDPSYQKQDVHTANVTKLLDQLNNIDIAGQTVKKEAQASFHCVLALVFHAEDPLPRIFHGQWHGTIIRERRGHCGFGYDPVFQPDHYSCTAAELSPEEKHRISHRAQAVNQLMQWLTTHSTGEPDTELAV